MGGTKKLFFIYNPYSGRGGLKTKLFEVLQIFSGAGYELTVHPTRAEKDATEQVRSLPDGYDLVVCSGGDGTLDEVVEGMMQRMERIPIGYIPSGTVNDFARSLKIPRNILQAARTAVEGRDFTFDIGTFNREHFVYIAAFGIFTDVSYSTRQDMKNVLGHMAYLLEGMKRLTAFPSYSIRFESEELCGEGDYLFGMVTNSRSVGGFKSIVGKNVQFDDGVFEVTLIKKPQNPLELQEIIAAILNKEINSEHMQSFRTAKLEIFSEESIPWTLDGEYGGECMYTIIQNHQKALAIRVNN